MGGVNLPSSGECSLQASKAASSSARDCGVNNATKVCVCVCVCVCWGGHKDGYYARDWASVSVVNVINTRMKARGVDYMPVTGQN